MTLLFVPAETLSALALPPVFLPGQPFLGAMDFQRLEVVEDIAVMRAAIALKAFQLSARVFIAQPAVDKLPFLGAPSERTFGAARMHVEAARAAAPARKAFQRATPSRGFFQKVFAFGEGRAVMVAGSAVEPTSTQEIEVRHA